MTWMHGRSSKGHRAKHGVTHQGKAGMHGRTGGASSLAWQAKQDAWKHKGQAKGQGISRGGSGSQGAH
jgi:hypothetical protein